MQLKADRISVEGPHGTLLPPTSVVVSDGDLVLVHGEPGLGISALGLALAGRLKPSSGIVTLDGATEVAALREIVAIVDAPSVSEPDGALNVWVVIGEELALAGKPATKHDTIQWLVRHDAAAVASQRFDTLSAITRTRLLVALAASRSPVRVLILDTPDRHTSDYETWLTLAKEYAAQGFAVIVLAATTPLSLLPEETISIGAQVFESEDPPVEDLPETLPEALTEEIPGAEEGTQETEDNA